MRIASPTSHGQSAALNVVARPKSLEGLRIGFLDNTKAPVDKMLRHLESRLRERFPQMQAIHVAKTGMGVPAHADAMEALEKGADVIINGLGD